MPLSKVPIIGDKLTIIDCFAALGESLRKRPRQNKFLKILSLYIKTKHLFLFSSGIASFYAALTVIKQGSGKREVILPAYTASSLVAAVKKIGLVPKLCDISLDDFNLEVLELADVVNERTLAIVGIHMFGLPMAGFKELKEKFKDVYLIEDCAQSFGSQIDNEPVGRLGDFSLFSFNRGKNFPLFGGGCLATDSDSLAERISSVYKAVCLRQSLSRNFIDFIKALAFTLAINPYIYGSFYDLISCFKDTAPPKDVFIGEMSPFQKSLGEIFSLKIKASIKQRINNATFLINGLKDVESLCLPKIKNNLRPIFNRLPILFNSKNCLEKAEHKLALLGIESSRMYLKPLHHIFDLGYNSEEFPNANKLAENLLVLPVHPLVKSKHLNQIILALKEAAYE